jgi:anthranilate synthase component 1
VRVRPDRGSFERSAQGFALAPVWTELLADVSTPVGVFPALAGDGPGILLESVERSERWGRYSFVAGDPAAIVVLDREGLRKPRRDGSTGGRDAEHRGCSGPISSRWPRPCGRPGSPTSPRSPAA